MVVVLTPEEVVAPDETLPVGADTDEEVPVAVIVRVLVFPKFVSLTEVVAELSVLWLLVVSVEPDVEADENTALVDDGETLSVGCDIEELAVRVIVRVLVLPVL